MILGFKDQFVSALLDGSKTHSIRAGSRWRVGLRADLYQKPRQRGMRLLYRAPVIRVQRVQIEGVYARNGEFSGDIRIDGESLSHDERDIFAWRDGFRRDGLRVGVYDHSDCFLLMMRFWHGRLPFDGQLVQWDYHKKTFI